MGDLGEPSDDEGDLSRAELFVAILGHELRTPLTAIIAAAQLLDESATGEGDHGLAARIEANARRLERLAAQLLDLGRIRQGRAFAIEPAACDLRAILDGCRAAEFTLDARGRTDGLWDRDRLAQVFCNLVSNAIEHASGPGRPVVTLDGENPAFVRASVHNAGAIPAELLPVAFEPFQRGRAKTRKRGVGLGLYIAHEIVIAHGGTISIDSTVERGTTVTLTLPRTRKA